MIDEPEGNENYGSTVSAPIFRAIAEQIMNTTDYLQLTGGFLKASIDKPSVYPPSAEVSKTEKGTIPDVCGLSLRQAMEILKKHKLTPRFTGTGVVIDQTPDAGSQITDNRTVWLRCRSRASAAIGSR